MNINFLRMLALVASALAAASVQADLVQMADQPMANSISPDVKTNVMFILDRSGSMAWSHMPDDPLDKSPNNMLTKVGYKSSQCNGVYYNPAITYTPPVYADGTSYPNSSFTAAWNDGFNTGSGTVNLSTSFQAYTGTTTASADYTGNDTAQPAYYFQYNGLNGTGARQTAMSYTYDPSGTVQSTQFWTECKVAAPAPVAPSPNSVCNAVATADVGPAASHTWTCVKVGAGEQQNFANWYSYYRTRITMMKTATGLAFKQINAPNTLRLGFVNHDLTNLVPIADYSDTTGVVNTTSCSSATTQRAKLYCYLYAASASGGTPTRTALLDTGEMYKGTGAFIGTNKPDPVLYSCQRNTAILATDGFWNTDTVTTIGNKDAATGVFDAGGNQSGKAPYNDTSPASSNSMADIAQYYWATDLRTSGLLATNNVPTSGKDPANWQHMVTFTLGLGGSGSLTYCAGYGNCTDPTTGIDTACISSCPAFESIRRGTTHWPDPTPTENVTRMDDLWHAAVNGRGTYFAATSVAALADGLKKAFAEAAATGAGAAAAVGNLVPAIGDGLYLARYRSVDWTGDLTKNLFTDANLDISPTPTWSAQTQLDTQVGLNTDSRNIWMARGGSLVTFSAANLSTQVSAGWFDAGPTNPGGALEQYQFFTSGTGSQQAAATPASLINYLRGQRGLEDPGNNILETNAAKIYRGRTHVLGDIVNSSPVYVGKPPFSYSEHGYSTWNPGNHSGTVYAAANDGMLHAFDAATGLERWAFVPTAVLANLYKLADKNYYSKHKYLVDGPLTVGDAYFGGAWHTVLIGGLGKGGRAYYALDVTNETAPTLLWEFAATSAGTTNSAATNVDADLGYTAGAAQITKLNGGNWISMFASGYDNISAGDGKARLYVVDLATGNKLSEILTSAGDTSPLTSGMAWVQGWTADGMHDNSVQHVYSGDVSGRVWRFDMVNGTSTLLTTVSDGTTAGTQPITSRIELGDWKGDINQRAVYVGTGRYLGYCDIDSAAASDTTTYPPNGICPAIYATIQNASTQSIYAIRDSSTAPRAAMGNFRTASPAPVALATVSGSNLVYNNVINNLTGWYFDLRNVHGQSGERVTLQATVTSDQNNLLIATNVPANNKCDIGGTGYVYFLNTQSQASTTVLISDFVYTVTGAMIVGLTTGTNQAGGFRAFGVDSSGNPTTFAPKTPSYGNNVRRVSWRELRN